ncbi:MAG: hypothetical protein KTR24_13510 [Saprospiraceae bacterium]|nr:hypothetical protein [Saprospiraceae bacterium]
MRLPTVTRTLIFFVILGFLHSCKGDAEIEIAPDFQPYVDRFVDEAAERGITIDFSDTGLSVVFRKAAQVESSGVCRGNHNIEIEKLYWDGLSDAEREGLIFHELGHCELDRRHRNDLLSNGEWASRMRGSPIPDTLNAVINYSEERRDYYIEELFNEAVGEPEWVNRREDFGDATRDTTKSLANVPAFEETLGLPFSADFEMEAIIDIQDNGSWMGFAWGGMDPADEIYVAYNGSKTFVIGSGSRVWSTMYQKSDFQLLDDRINKLTVRRRGDFYYVFLNETFIYWFDYLPLASARFRSIVGSQNAPNFMEVRVHRLSN